jgi:hypothetical protein
MIGIYIALFSGEGVIMKKIILSIMVIAMIFCLHSAPRSLSEARVISENFLQQRGIEREIDLGTRLENGEADLYIFNIEEDGFIVTSADDDFYPVIAYSWLGSYTDETSEDLQFVFIREDQLKRGEYYASNRQAAAENRQAWNDLTSGTRENRTFQQWPMSGNTSTGGWCDTQWTQSGIFNQFCPIDNTGNRSVVGCVATAMAQIMHFHEYIGNPVFSSSDNYSSGWWNAIYIDSDHEERDFPNWSELNGYLNIAASHYSNGEIITSQDLAALNYACGVSVEMSYSSSGSGAYTEDVASALRNKFDYDSAVWNENNGGNFYTNIAQDMKEMQPCEFSIYTSGWNDGHAIVCDGYNTDSYYHLNYGWGSSNIGWYHIPSGMPSNYSIIGGAVRNIEGGEFPIFVNGNLSGMPDPNGSYIFFSGEKYHYEAYADNSGAFNIPALKPGWYTVSAIGGRLWYAEEEIYLDTDNQSIELDMYNYDALEGNISADIPTSGSIIALYEDNNFIAQTISDLNGYFAIPDILPGTYHVTASLTPDYYGYNSVTVDTDNQFVSIVMENYSENYEINWFGEPIQTHTLIPLQISCAIRLTAEDLAGHQEDVFSGISFISPISSDEGTIVAELWRENELLIELAAQDYAYGEEVLVEFPYFSEVLPGSNYYAGYRVDTYTGDIAWRDAGPRISGRGAWFRITNWVELSSTFDFNFCINAHLIGAYVSSPSNTAETPQHNYFAESYPNPYRQNSERNQAVIKFQLHEAANAMISLYNLKGQRVEQIAKGQFSAGEHQIAWQPQGLGSGIYFYMLSIDGIAGDYKKVIILK